MKVFFLSLFAAIMFFSCAKKETPNALALVVELGFGQPVFYPDSAKKIVGGTGGELKLSWTEDSRSKYDLFFSQGGSEKSLFGVHSPYLHKGLVNDKLVNYRLIETTESGEKIEVFATATPQKSLALDAPNPENRVIPYSVQAIGAEGIYKPNIIRITNNHLLITAFEQIRNGSAYYEHILFFESFDGGKTWSDARIPKARNSDGKLDDMYGREAFPYILTDGTIIITSHFLGEDSNNKTKKGHARIFASYDSGSAWIVNSIIDSEITTVSRHPFEMTNGDLILGESQYEAGGKSFLYKSTNRGNTWVRDTNPVTTDFPKNYAYGFFDEGVFQKCPDGTINLIQRVDPLQIPKVGIPVSQTNDQQDHMLISKSKDNGKTWVRKSDIGDYGEMYPNLMKLKNGRTVFTYTVRSLKSPFGLRACFGKETNDGFSLNFDTEKVILEAETAVGVSSGGGFGGTIELDDGTLISVYSYRKANQIVFSNVVRWRY